MKAALVKRATVLFPRRDYLNESSVRHARRQWVEATARLNELGLQPYQGLNVEAQIVWNPNQN